MTNLIPHFILDNYNQKEVNGRFTAVSLFADISGFSTVTSTLLEHGSEAAEIIAEIMLDIFEPLVDAVYAQGGFITTFAGDAFTALFSFDEDSDESASPYERALAAAVAIQEVLAANPVQETEHGRFSFSVKVGIADGEVEWGILTPEEPLTVPSAYYFRGSAVDAAAQAEHHALPGHIIVTASVADFLVDVAKTVAVADQYERVLTITDDLPPPFLPALPESPLSQEAFIPEIILQKQDRGGFRQIVTVFINVMGLHNDADLGLFLQSIFTLQTKYGGYLNKVDFGDKGCNLLLFWGTPVSFENDLDRVLNFILELSHLSSAIFKAGITLQRTYTGLAGSARRGEFTCYGTGVNMAARLMVAAPWGEIWSDAQVGHHAQTLFTFREEEARQFKGFVEPQPVYSLIERQEMDLAGFYQGEMVGRKAELAQLATFIAPVLNREQAERFAGILVVEGEAGLGKSRLITEFCLNQQDGATPFQVYRAQTDQTVRAGLNPFRYWLRNYFDQSSIHSDSRNKRAFGRRLDKLLAQTADEELQQTLQYGRSFLGALIGLHWENSAHNDIPPEGRLEWTVTALKALLKTESVRQPLILVLEDAHWLDQESVAFMERLVRQMEPYPLAIIATARPMVGDKPLFGTAAYARLPLQLMTGDELQRVGTAVLGQPLNQDLTDLLIARAEGNPFFAEQILLYLQEEGRLTNQDGAWTLMVDKGTQSVLPGDVRAIFTARLDRLTDEVKQVVQTAAVLGREFDVQLLSRMLQNDESLPDKLEAASAEAIWVPLNQLRYLFKHGLLRDATYEMQLRAQRRELHLLAAQTLEKLYIHDLTSHYRDIATHYEAAYAQGLATAQEPAHNYIQKAAAQAATQYENDTAIDYYHRALALTDPKAVETRFQLLLALSKIHHLQANWEAEAAILTELQTIADTRQYPGKKATVTLARIRNTVFSTRYEDGLPLIPQAVALAQAAQDIELEAESCLWLVALAYEDNDLFAARNLIDQALSLAQLAGNKELEIQALRSLAGWFVQHEEYEQAEMYSQQALTLARQTNSHYWEAIVLSGLGAIFKFQMAFDAAFTYYSEALILSRTIGAKFVVFIRLIDIGNLCKFFGQYAQAEDYYQQYLQICQEIYGPDYLHPYACLCGLAPYIGQREKALSYMEIVQHLRGKRDIDWDEKYFYYTEGNVWFWLSRWAEAEVAYQTAIQYYHERTHEVREFFAGLARAQLAQGKQTQAFTTIADLIPLLEDNNLLGVSEEPLWIYLTCYQVLRAVDDPRAQHILENAHTILQAKAAQISDEAVQHSFLHNVPHHQAILDAYRGEDVPVTYFCFNEEEVSEAVTPALAPAPDLFRKRIQTERS